ncbi:hypothetical protein KSP40_PGU021075 [Platanthera guangdongensis]|uniref:Uncharacterized protein n=1 Tax=Platanthera guangdongensis TaxID=2320717 RepID=A0ABR2LDR7_9ASPA
MKNCFRRALSPEEKTSVANRNLESLGSEGMVAEMPKRKHSGWKCVPFVIGTSRKGGARFCRLQMGVVEEPMLTPEGRARRKGNVGEMVSAAGGFPREEEDEVAVHVGFGGEEEAEDGEIYGV